MTSSSDAGAWQPLDLVHDRPDPSAPPASPVPFTAAAVAAWPAGASGDWLPPLRTHGESAAEDARRRREEDAFRRGREDAIRLERDRVDALCATALQAVGRAAGHLGTIADEFARDRERDLQGLAIAIARHIVQHELTIDPLRVGELVRRALEMLPSDHEIEVRLNPEDLRTLGPSLASLGPGDGSVKLQWVGDPSIERGGFVAETPQRIVDGRADVALRALYERFDHE